MKNSDRKNNFSFIFVLVLVAVVLLLPLVFMPDKSSTGLAFWQSYFRNIPVFYAKVWSAIKTYFEVEFPDVWASLFSPVGSLGQAISDFFSNIRIGR